ncbi:hypothetical protein MM239_00720 [Belliella sp. DSM 111904]|uniref:DUF1461 domain-containing protein n=1 Tax=Belliella filtrata TaxID=2923435 RepID=A0ABS9UVS3_9BACT|nr:hypothetical protein [Belliella filtrata]MCH7407903.1 hypothetical protein [Belliella filtrata]
MEDFYQAYFDHTVPQEYIDKIKENAIVWNGMEHDIVLREANLIRNLQGNSEYLLKYWVTFENEMKFSYAVNVLEKNGNLTLNRFEPIDVNILSSFYAPDTNFAAPLYSANISKIAFFFISIFGSILLIIFLTIRKKNYLLLLTIPLLFIYKQGLIIFNFKGFEILSSKFHFGLPFFKNIDLHFSSISLTMIGVFCVWAIIAVYLYFSARRNNKMNYGTA